MGHDLRYIPYWLTRLPPSSPVIVYRARPTFANGAQVSEELDMRILVTGHRGYIGTVMVPMLLSSGHDVVGLDGDLYERCTYADGAAAAVPSLRRDVRDVTLGDLDDFDACIHLAALSNDPFSDINPPITLDINHHPSAPLACLLMHAGL